MNADNRRVMGIVSLFAVLLAGCATEVSSPPETDDTAVSPSLTADLEDGDVGTLAGCACRCNCSGPTSTPSQRMAIQACVANCNACISQCSNGQKQTSRTLQAIIRNMR